MIPNEESNRTFLFSVTEEESENVHAITAVKQVSLINGSHVEALVDTGASVNVISQAVHNHLKNKPALQSTNLKIFRYVCQISVRTSNSWSVMDTFYVVGPTSHLH